MVNNYSQEIKVYLDSLREELKTSTASEFSATVLNHAWTVWNKIESRFSQKGLSLETPDACTGLEDNFMYAWMTKNHHLECEIFGSGRVEFFYRNNDTKEVWGEDITVSDELPISVLAKLDLFATLKENHAEI